jgi:hypothetical protein
MPAIDRGGGVDEALAFGDRRLLIRQLIDHGRIGGHGAILDQIGNRVDIQGSVERAVRQFDHPDHFELGNSLGIDPGLLVFRELMAGRDTPLPGPAEQRGDIGWPEYLTLLDLKEPLPLADSGFAG